MKALALATIANQKYREAVAFERQMARLLGLSEHIGDSRLAELVYTDEPFSVETFDRHLTQDEITVEAGDGHASGLRRRHEGISTF